MQVELVSPEKVVFSGEATQVITRTLGGGEIAFLPGHAPFVGALTENHTRITLADGEQLDVAVHGGFVQVGNNKVSILSDIAELGTDIDRGRAVAAKERAEARSGPRTTLRPQQHSARANARLNASGGQAAGVRLDRFATASPIGGGLDGVRSYPFTSALVTGRVERDRRGDGRAARRAGCPSGGRGTSRRSARGAGATARRHRSARRGSHDDGRASTQWLDRMARRRESHRPRRQQRRLRDVR